MRARAGLAPCVFMIDRPRLLFKSSPRFSLSLVLKLYLITSKKQGACMALSFCLCHPGWDLLCPLWQLILDIAIAPELRYLFFPLNDVAADRDRQHGVIRNIGGLHNGFRHVPAGGPHLRPTGRPVTLSFVGYKAQVS